MEEEVFLHPRSALHAAAPDLVVYISLLATDKRTYMSTLTTVDAAWLAQVGRPLATISEPLRDPAPFYSKPRDAVLGWCDATYGQHTWPLPLHSGMKLRC